MKNKETVLFVVITLLFVFLTVGFLIGRNIGRTNIIVSKNETAANTLETDAIYVIDGKININIADILTLCELPGIGQIMAERIVQYRKEHGEFTNISDIMHVTGIGEKTYNEIADLITVGK